MDPTLDPLKMPIVNGNLLRALQRWFRCHRPLRMPCDCAATNGAAPGYYRIGILNSHFGADAMPPPPPSCSRKTCSPNSNYVVVTALVLTNGFSTVWVNPSSQSSPSVTDTTPAPAATNLYNIAAFELRESGANGGIGERQHSQSRNHLRFRVPLAAYPAGGAANVIVSWSDPTLAIQSTTNLLNPFFRRVRSTPPYTNNASINKTMFFRFGQ